MKTQTSCELQLSDELHEECGVFGIYDCDGWGSAQMTYYALYALQHRGQESAGIAVNDLKDIRIYKNVGLVPEVFSEKHLNDLAGGVIGIGHVRYSTTGSNKIENAQPLTTSYVKGTITLAHNGNLVNSAELRHELVHQGTIFQTTNDSEIITCIIAKERLNSKSIEEAISRAMPRLKGAYSVVLMSSQKLIAFRDPVGFRPLCIGKKGNSYVFASESCALDAIGAEYVREVEAGEIVIIEKGQLRSIRDNCTGHCHLCSFEFVYIARPDSNIHGQNVHLARQQAGRFLAQEHPVDADIVIGAPDSGLDAALGYSMESGIPYAFGFIKNRYIGRTFIQPTQQMREVSVSLKLNPIREIVAGKRVILIDDSIVRGTTSKRIVDALKRAGAAEVHMRICSPPFTHPCYFGVDIDSQEHLIACKMSHEEICKTIGADSLGYLSLEHVVEMSAKADCDYCTGCFTGKYPIDMSKYAILSKDRLEHDV